MKAAIAIPPHGGQLKRIAERFDIPASDLLDFSANINPDGPPASVVEALRAALDDPAVLSAYPDLEETQLRLSISAYADVATEAIAVANGFVPLLDAVLRMLPIRRCLLPVPAFGEYRGAIERANVAVTPYVLGQETGFHYEPDALLRAMTTDHCDAILLANPQNPSGVLSKRSDLETLIEEAAKLNVYVLLDEAFIDYVPMHSMAHEVERFANLIVFRSVTKFHGMPGLRVAYAVGAAARGVRKNLAPWAITTMAAIGVCAALSDEVYAERMRQLNQRRRELLVTQLHALGLHTYSAAANFLLLRFPSAAEAENRWERLIRDHGVVLRHCGNFEGLAQNHLRCAVRGDEENSRLIQALADRRSM
jgi:threonine-phosphate decarboxylase